MSQNLKIAIVDSSSIIRCGLENILRKLSGYRITTIELNTPDNLRESIRMHKPDVLIINPIYGTNLDLTLKEEDSLPDIKIIALVYVPIDPNYLKMYDAQISIFDQPGEIGKKLEMLFVKVEKSESEDDSQALSGREKEIVVCVVKGMTNREIADTLYLSTHTVITHRRNIARKLQIHSASGLTVYAIVNKLVELSDLKDADN